METQVILPIGIVGFCKRALTWLLITFCVVGSVTCYQWCKAIYNRTDAIVYLPCFLSPDQQIEYQVESNTGHSNKVKH